MDLGQAVFANSPRFPQKFRGPRRFPLTQDGRFDDEEGASILYSVARVASLKLEGHSKKVHYLDIAPSARQISSSGAERRFRVGLFTTGKCIWQHEPASGWLLAIQSRWVNCLALLSHDKVEVWDLTQK